MPVTRRLARIASDTRFDDIPPSAREVARHCALDWFGVAIAGSREPLADILVAEVAGGEPGEATLIARPERTTPLTAALINGAMSHALDFDDTHTRMSGHPSVPVIPAALALAERDGAGGRAFIEAIVAGVEVECRLGALVNPGHYASGFHATGTLGTFGAAAATARLLGLDEERTTHALALAGTQAAGLKSGFGTMAKPLHAGRAATNGLLSALLAKSGFTGSPEVIETAQGFAATHGAAALDERTLDALDGRWLITETLFKYHAACYLTHAAIEAALELRRAHGWRAYEVEGVTIDGSTACIGVCDIAEPDTGLGAKFSIRATVAMALLGDEMSDPAAYSDARAVAADAVAMREKVVFVPHDDRPGTRATVVVRARGGEFTASADTGRPAENLAAQWERLSAKFHALTTPVTGRGAAERLYDALAGLERLDSMRDAVALTRPVGAGVR
jgi:2-methylcitrate dehydratase PrpD